MPKRIRPGFTLVETLIVLAISTLIMALLVFLMAMFPQKNIQEKAFWRCFDEQWNSSIQAAKDHGQITDVRVRPDKNIVLFEQFKNNHFEYQRVQMPDGLRPIEVHEIRITDKGFVKPQTLNWYSQNRHCGIHQKFQLGWGIYYCEDY
ncbi:prepilin-type N-terminal cleavage/methylation domain-containing protein [Fructilactobacillus frigidiflavus]|uniref:prepilin-type N-terminal cleavage/methylation domain-containing protein n=1 Tax=Fructilactobacillus frigidiflavus TaxID=3242688 RepID=UPI003757DB54